MPSLSMEHRVISSGFFGQFLYYFVMPTDCSAVVIYANHAQFAPAQTVAYGPVESRMVLWCLAGTGVVVANGHKVPMTPGVLLLLPWHHAIRYRASADDPFLLGGIHFIPRHGTRQPLQFQVAHTASHPLAKAAWRQDAPLAGIPDFKVSRLAAGSPLAHLLAYIVAGFIRGEPSPAWARQTAAWLLQELRAAENLGIAPAGPPSLERMKEYVQFHLHQPVSLVDLAAFARLSPATVGRLFRQHLGTTPVTWIQQVKMEQARSLLRTRRLSIAEVAAAVGFADPYYFSKCFKKQTGQSPREYRRSTPWL